MKQQHPKILLIDMNDQTSDLLEQAGYSTTEAIYGVRYNVMDKRGDTQLLLNHTMPPNISEHDIVVIDLSIPKPVDEFEGKPIVTSGGRTYVVDQTYIDTIDSRAFASLFFQSEFDRILATGGVFIVFAAPESTLDVKLVEYEGRYTNTIDTSECSQWGFCTPLKNLDIFYNHGEIVNFSDSFLTKLLNKYQETAFFSCTIRKNYRVENFFPLATNKHGDYISAIILEEQEEKLKSLILVLPQFGKDDKASIVSELISEYLPDILPNIFPDAENNRWLNSSKYKFSKTLKLEENIETIKQNNAKEIAKIQEEINHIYEENQYISDLITQYQEPLVQAVMKSLEILGFNDVIDVDQEQAKLGKDKREDLRIEDNPDKYLLVEVKGSNGIFTEDDILTVRKYKFRRAEYLKTFNVKGLTIINHQKGLEPLQRQNPFDRDLILANAIEDEIGLMTTWTLYRLVRNFLSNNWKPEYVQNLFYKSGVIEPIPTHYQDLGNIVKIFPDLNVIAIDPKKEISVGDKIAIDTDVDYIELEILSLMVKDKQVQTAQIDDPTGVNVQDISRLKDGLTVYLINR